MDDPVKAIAITTGLAMHAPEIRALFRRSYQDDKFDTDPEELLDFLATELDGFGEELKLFVAWGESTGFCGMALVVLSVNPISPYPWVNHFVAENPEARNALGEAVIGLFQSKGVKKFSIYNQTGHGDDAHIRLYRKFARGTVKGSLIVYQLEK